MIESNHVQGLLQETLNYFGSKSLFLAIGLAILCTTISTMCGQHLYRSKPLIQDAYISQPSIEYYVVL